MRHQSITSVSTHRFQVFRLPLLTYFTHCLPNTKCRNSVHPLASSSSSPCLNHHGVWQRQVLMTNAHFWRPLCWWPCRAVSLVPLPSLTSSPVPRAPPHLPHLSILPCSTAWAGSHRKNACTANSTRAVQEDNIVWAATMLFTQRGDLAVFLIPECILKSPEQRNAFGLYSTLA